MRTSDEIVKDVLKYSDPPEDYKILEIYCFFSIKKLLDLYKQGVYTKEECTKTKQQILANYSNEIKQQEFWEAIYQEHLQHIKDTEMARTKLRKRLNEEDEITEEKLAECLNLALEILSRCFKGEF